MTNSRVPKERCVNPPVAVKISDVSSALSAWDRVALTTFVNAPIFVLLSTAFGSNPTHEHLLGYHSLLLPNLRKKRLKLGGDTDNGRSTGYTFILGGGSIAWAAQKQGTVALLSTKAEYMALAEWSNTLWTLSLLQQSSFDIDLPLDLFSDSSVPSLLTTCFINEQSI